jgi:hypothetical protein
LVANTSHFIIAVNLCHVVKTFIYALLSWCAIRLSTSMPEIQTPQTLQETWKQEVQRVHTPGRTQFICPGRPVLIKLPWAVAKCIGYHVRREAYGEAEAKSMVRKFGAFLQTLVADKRNAFIVVEPPRLMLLPDSVEFTFISKVYLRAVELDDDGRPTKRARCS